MKKEIVVNVMPNEKRAALLEDGRLMELYIERTFTERVAGNIYKGRVENVLPGMEAAFVNIGLERNAFLYMGDALSYGGTLLEEDLEVEGVAEEQARRHQRPEIEKILREGREIVVQVAKEPMGKKGARVVTQLTLPGRYVVLVPGESYIGISRRIERPEERERLLAVAGRLRPSGMGLIIRTAAEGCEEEELEREIKFLLKVWEKVEAKAARVRAPALLYQDYDLTYQLVRDVFTEDVERIVLDGRAEFEQVRELLSSLNPRWRRRVSFYQSPVPIFDFYGIEPQIERALKRKVWLESGGYLVIDHTEALVSIDVNTGKFVGSTSLEETVLQTNLEAAVEIARQLRLRNMAGIIIVDFIDMESEADRQKVLRTLAAEVKKDRVKTTVVGFSALGLMEITRKKVRRDLDEVLQRQCPYCDGTGRILSEETVAMAVERRLQSMAEEKAEAFLVTVHPSVAALVIGAGGSNLRRLEESLGKAVFVRGSLQQGIAEISIVAGTKEEMERLAIPVREGQRLQVRVEEPHVTNRQDGIARVEGYVIDVEGGGALVGQKVNVEITRAFRTYAKGRIVSPASEGQERRGEAQEGLVPAEDLSAPSALSPSGELSPPTEGCNGPPLMSGK
ncbi:MAG: Rne/Rng family ribonuclease [Bacillota bacterium]|nr:Rne/Rng family ribonuclease [Bacillota bacterium]